MNRISLSKQLAFVLFLVALAPGISFGKCPTGFYEKPTRTTVVINNQPTVVQGDPTCEPDPNYNSKIAECKTALTKLNENKETFLSYCKAEDGTPTISTCSTKLRECSTVQTESLNISGMASMMGMAGMPDIMGDRAGSCSKYTQDKLDSLIRDAKREQQDMEKLGDKKLEEQAKMEEKILEDAKKIKEEWTKLKEDKANAEYEAKEKARNDKAALSQRVSEASAQIRQMRTEIATLQRKQNLLLKKRKLDISNQVSVVARGKAVCRAEVRKEFDTSRTASLQRTQRIQKEKEEAFLGCMEEKMNAIKMAGEEFTAAMSEIDEMIANKSEDLAAAEKSLIELQKMFAEAEADKNVRTAKEEEAFQEKQVAMWQTQIEQDNQARQQRINMANQISKNNMDTIQAGNELMKLKGQETFDDKTPRQVGDFLSKYNAAVANYKNLGCGKIEGDSGLPTDKALGIQ